jgi:uncharacterized membrane protein
MFDSSISFFYQILTHIGYRHPVHPLLVHMTIGLVIGAFVFGTVGALFRRKTLPQSAWHCITLAFLILFPTVLLGFMDWKHFYAGAWLFPIKMKLIIAAILFVLLFAGTLVGRRAQGQSLGALIIYGLCFLNVIGMGYFGGELVYGVTQSSAPMNFQAGEQLYKNNCSACHPNGGNTITPGKPVTGSAKTADFKTFLAWIRGPNPPMPPFPETKISDKQSTELYQYIVHELKK